MEDFEGPPARPYDLVGVGRRLKDEHLDIYPSHFFYISSLLPLSLENNDAFHLKNKVPIEQHLKILNDLNPFGGSCDHTKS